MQIATAQTDMNAYGMFASIDNKTMTIHVGQKFHELSECAQDFIVRHLSVVRIKCRGDAYMADRYAYYGMIKSAKYTPEEIATAIYEALDALTLELKVSRLDSLAKYKPTL